MEKQNHHDYKMGKVELLVQKNNNNETTSIAVRNFSADCIFLLYWRLSNQISKIYTIIYPCQLNIIIFIYR